MLFIALKPAGKTRETSPRYFNFPNLFTLTMEAFCPALLSTSFHSSSSPRIIYLSEKGKKKKKNPSKIFRSTYKKAILLSHTYSTVQTKPECQHPTKSVFGNIYKTRLAKGYNSFLQLHQQIN